MSYKSLKHFLSELEVDYAVYLVYDYKEKDFTEMNELIGDIFTSEIGTNEVEFTDAFYGRMQDIMYNEIMYFLKLRFNCISPQFSENPTVDKNGEIVGTKELEPSLIRPRNIEYIITDEEKYKEFIDDPSLILF